MSTLRERLTEAMGDSIKQTHLAKACDISRAAVAGWFSDEKPVQELKAAHVFAVARKCNVDPEWLATGRGKKKREQSSNPDRLPPHRLSLIKAYGTLPPDVRKPIRSLIETLFQAGRADYFKYERDLEQRQAKVEAEET